jgi:hypothetical protein
MFRDYLDGYFVGKVAAAAYLHEAITAPDTDGELIDHTSLVLMAIGAAAGWARHWRVTLPRALFSKPMPGHTRRQAPTSTRFTG